MVNEKKTHLDLFTGIGGFSLAIDNVWPDVEHTFCEIDLFCQQVLKKHWPKSKIYGDIRKLKGKRGSADIITGGFPCQPYSQAGKRRGKEDDRHLWPEMLRIIKEVSPRWVVGENVRGLTNWNGGVVFDEVQSDLEALGYEVIPFLLPACAVGAWHRRDRIWIIAHANSDGQPIKPLNGKQGQRKLGLVADTESEWRGRERRRQRGTQAGHKKQDLHIWEHQPLPDRVANGIPDRVDRLKALGNAIVPQVAEEIFKAIKLWQN